MNDPTSPQASSDASSSTHSSSWQYNPPSFLGIPRELRDHIYGYLVTVDQHFDYEDRNKYNGVDFQDLAITRVNRQIRAESLNCLVRKNLWVSVTHVDMHEECVGFDEHNPYGY
ncbi:uncharacterized protein PG986_000646 [Apiospora aurea]|uniref:Uncharacterized protein n=1 Tax=Apiospora aurea TaxID=335848 RepID=A0ABR1QUP0_9PEZI